MTATKFVVTQVFIRYTLSLVNMHVVSTPQVQPLLDAKYFALSFEDRKMNVRIYTVKSTQPRAYLVFDWRWFGNHERTMNDLENAILAGFDFSKTTILEHLSAHDDPVPAITQDVSKFTDPNARLDLMTDQAEHLSFSVSTKKPCFLVLCDQYYPGWQVHRDAIRNDIYRANGVMRAVFIPPGSHLVDFNFKPDCLDDGMRLALLGLVCLSPFVLILIYRILPKG